MLKVFKRNKGELIYLASSFVVPVVGFFSSFLIARFVSPEENGLIESYLLILPYLAFIQLGVFNGLNRNIAFYRAQENEIKVRLQVATSLWISKIVSIVSLIAIISFIVFSKRNEVLSFLDISTIIAVVLIGALAPLSSHIDTTFRSSQDFKKLGKIRFYEAGIQLVTLGFLPFIHAYGKLLIQVSKSVSGYLFRLVQAPIKVVAKFDKASYMELLGVGFPLLLGGYLWSLFAISDQSIIAIKLGDVALGNYFLSKLVIITMMLVPTSLTVILYPRASAIYGKSNSRKELKNFFWVALGINVVLLSVISLILYVGLELFVVSFIPKYIDGIDAAKINIITGLSFISHGPGVIMGVLKRNQFYLVLVSISLISMWLIGTLMNVTDISQIAGYRAVISILLAIGTLIYSYYLTTTDDIKDS